MSDVDDDLAVTRQIIAKARFEDYIKTFRKRGL